MELLEKEPFAADDAALYEGHPYRVVRCRQGMVLMSDLYNPRRTVQVEAVRIRKIKGVNHEQRS